MSTTDPPLSSPTAALVPASFLSCPRSTISKESLHKQLTLEERLQEIGGELIDLYKETKQWIQVGQLAQVLNSNSERIASLVSSLDDSVFIFPMEGEPYKVSVVNDPAPNNWIIKLSDSAQPISRSLKDINNIKLHLSTKYSLSITQEDIPSCDDVQLLLSTALKDEIIKQDNILACFLSSKIKDFSQVQDNTLGNKLTNGSTASKLTTGNTNNETNATTTSTNNESTIEPTTSSNDTTMNTNVITTTTNVITTVNEGTNSEGTTSLSEAVNHSKSPSESSQTEIAGHKEEENKASSSAVSIDEYENSPHMPKRQVSSPSPDSLKSPTSPLLQSSLPPHLQSVVSKPESSSDEVCSPNDDRTSESDATGQPLSNGGANLLQKGRSQSLAGEQSSPSTKQSSKSLKKKFAKSGKKNKSIAEEEPTVSLASPQATIEWDPTCLLEELYNDCQPGVGQSQSGENSRYSGYLEKLPVNQRKPTFTKGWKHRFFRLTRGSLFYYDAENSTKATSFIRLSDSKIVQHPETLKIEIIEKGGNFIMLRAESREEMATWSRVLQLESIHPTMTHRLSLSPGRSDSVIIIDLGACSVRAGIVNDNTYPQVFFPTICAASDDKIIACGNDALLPGVRTSAKLVYPCRRRLRLDSTLPVRECFQSIIEKICKMLKVEPQNCSVLVCISPVMPESEQISLCEVLLEVLNFKSILVQEQTTMALYSYNHTSGIVVNIGDTTDVVPIIDGFKVDSGTSHSPFGGHSITEALSKLATSHGIRYFSEAEMYIVRFIKESICFLSQDYLTDCVQCEEAPAEYKRAVDVDRFQLSDHKKVIHLDSALFTATEGLFTPGVWGKDTIALHEMVQKAIEQCPIDMRRQMVRHIYLSGGTTLLVGLQERLQKELEHLFPRLEIQVHGSDNRHHASFLGAGVLASLNSFTKSLVDLESWQTKGLEAMRQSETS